ncbi:glycosidase [Alicyclobacillaceae bacterium I2511]|nr:glycosidase [Alicyclobacillaceae bacterium I2511]
MGVHRFSENPLLTPRDIEPHRRDFEVLGAFNAGVAIYQNEILLLLRVAERPVQPDQRLIRVPVWDVAREALSVETLHNEHGEYDVSDPRSVVSKVTGRFAYLSSLSYLRMARSRDGIHFTVDADPFMFPATAYETFGIEDPRITQIEDEYFITYTSVSPFGVSVSLAVTRDFQTVRRLGVIFPPENKDVVIFPEKIGNQYFALHRPVPGEIGGPEIWIADSPDLVHWGNHTHLLGVRSGRWDSRRLGAGAVPLRTKAGWLEVYHAADKQGRYALGAVLLDLVDPRQVLARSSHPLLAPEMPYELNGFYGNVVFTCGTAIKEDILHIYYGVADSAMAGAKISLSEVLSSLSTI